MPIVPIAEPTRCASKAPRFGPRRHSSVNSRRPRSVSDGSSFAFLDGVDERFLVAHEVKTCAGWTVRVRKLSVFPCKLPQLLSDKSIATGIGQSITACRVSAKLHAVGHDVPSKIKCSTPTAVSPFRYWATFLNEGSKRSNRTCSVLKRPDAKKAGWPLMPANTHGGVR
jgi:hypothetical protein